MSLANASSVSSILLVSSTGSLKKESKKKTKVKQSLALKKKANHRVKNTMQINILKPKLHIMKQKRLKLLQRLLVRQSRILLI